MTPFQVPSFMGHAGYEEQFSKQGASRIDTLNTEIVEDNHCLDHLHQKPAFTKKVPADFVATALIRVMDTGPPCLPTINNWHTITVDLSNLVGK